jgi:hypothetical protein
MTLTGLANATAGTPQSPTVTFYDEFNNIATGYTGTVQFSSNDPQGVLPAPYTFSPADAGTHTFGSGLMLKSAASITVNVTNSTGVFTAGQTITINPGPAVSLQVSGLHDLTLFEGQPTPKQQFRVEALDQYGNVATGYTGTAKFDGGDYPQYETLPTPSTLTNGRGVFEMSTSVIQNDCHYGDIPRNYPPITPTCAGYERVTATDTVNPAITGYQRFQVGAVVTPATYFIAPPTCPDSTNCMQLADGVVLNTDLPVYVDITNVNSDGSINGTMTATGANGVTVKTSVTMAAPEIYVTGTIVDVTQANNSAPAPVNLTVTGGQQLGYGSAATFSNNVTVTDPNTQAPISEPPGTVISQFVNIGGPDCVLGFDSVLGVICENNPVPTNGG